jgi:copper chaperone CopZ
MIEIAERGGKTMLWKFISGLIASTWIAFVMPVIGESLAGPETNAVQPPTETITLKIEGWTCASCEKDIRRALTAVPGVKHADVSYPRGGAAVEVEPGRTTSEDLVRAVADAGNILSSYRAIVVPNGTLTAESSVPNGADSWWRRLFK